MIESKIIVNRYLNFVMPTPAVGALGAFITQPPILKTIEESKKTVIESSGFKSRISNISSGIGAKLHRNFQWLDWVKGSVNQVVFGTTDVLTGPMSGCWIANYKIGGIEYVGHIGTFNDANTPQSIAAKAAWNQFANANPLNVLGGFKPKWNGAFPPSMDGDFFAGQTTFGLVTKNEYFTIAAWRKNSKDGYRIAGIQPNMSSPLAVLQAIV